MLSTMDDRLNSGRTNVKKVASPRYIASLVKIVLADFGEREQLLQRARAPDVKALRVVDAQLAQ